MILIREVAVVVIDILCDFGVVWLEIVQHSRNSGVEAEARVASTKASCRREWETRPRTINQSISRSVDRRGNERTLPRSFLMDRSSSSPSRSSARHCSTLPSLSSSYHIISYHPGLTRNYELAQLTRRSRRWRLARSPSYGVKRRPGHTFRERELRFRTNHSSILHDK